MASSPKSVALVTTIDVCRVTPSLNSSEFSLPITTFDICLIRTIPVEPIFFYELTESSPSFFNLNIIPNLKHSLSLLLPHFLPVAGNLIWPPNSPLPILRYSPNDSVSFTVAESNADFHRLSSHKPHAAAESCAYIPELETSESKASVMSFKITNFPNQGFCIGISAHHAAMDGRSASMFIKAWAQISKQAHQSSTKEVQLSPDLVPFYDRTQTQDPEQITVDFLNLLPNKSSRSLHIMPSDPPKQELVRATFELSDQDIQRLREEMVSQLNQPIHLSSFVIALAYAIVCRAKSKPGKQVMLIIAMDFRAKFDPPLPDNYFGNCVGAFQVVVKNATVEDGGTALVAKEIREGITGFDEGALEKWKEWLRRLLADWSPEEPDGLSRESEVIGTAGSPRLGFYNVDFGWGRPVMVDIASINKTRAISVSERRGGHGGIEIGLALEKSEMEKFEKIFAKGLA